MEGINCSETDRIQTMEKKQFMLFAGYSLCGHKNTNYGQFKFNFCGIFTQVGAWGGVVVKALRY